MVSKKHSALNIPPAPAVEVSDRRRGFAPVAFTELAKTFTALADQCFADGRLDDRSLITEYQVLGNEASAPTRQSIRLLATVVIIAGTGAGDPAARELHVQARFCKPGAESGTGSGTEPVVYDHGDGQTTGWKVNCALHMRDNLAHDIQIRSDQYLGMPPFNGEELFVAPELNNLHFYLTRQRDLNTLRL